MSREKTAIWSAVTLVLVGCGGGGGSSGNSTSTPPNSPPTISGIMVEEVASGARYSSSVSAADPDGDTLTWTINGNPEWLAIDRVTGEVSGLPTLADIGQYPDIAITVSDGVSNDTLAFELSVTENTFVAERTELAEGAGSGQISINVAQPTDIAVSVSYTLRSATAVLDSDFVGAAGNLIFGAGETAAVIDIAIIDDPLFELTEELIIELDTADPYVSAATDQPTPITILDNDAMPLIQAKEATVIGNEGSTAEIVFSLSSPSGVDTSFIVAATPNGDIDGDYSTNSFSGVIPAGTTDAGIQIDVFADALNEYQESIGITLDSADFAEIDPVSSETVLILEDWRRSLLLGTPSVEEVYAVDVSSDGALFVAGRTYGSLYRSNTTDNLEGFISKISRASNVLWGVQKDSNQDILFDMELDSQGFILTVGYESGHYVRKHDPNGVVVWERTVTAGGRTRAVAIDNQDNVYAVGYSSVSFDGNSPLGQDDAVIVKYDSNGEKVWSRQFGSSEIDQAVGVATDVSGNVYVAGYTRGDADGGGLAEEADTFIAKYDRDGAQLWIKQYRDLIGEDPVENRVAYLWNLQASADGHLFAAGHATGTVGTEHYGAADIVIAKLTLRGDISWISQVGTPETDLANDIGLLTSGDVVVSGYTLGELSGQSNRGGRDAAVVIVAETDGALIAASQFGSAGDDEIFGVAVSDNDDIYLAGFAGTGTFEDEPLSNDMEALVIKVDSEGRLR
ncbi:SBBP repeat-containing protein [Lentisalinibacter sediminis]|uniref:SBBP repeat-containing protein n=1 Tax=Lentisalinibacter sediminis TaxID=2992237 RepID=UPI00386A2C6C